VGDWLPVVTDGRPGNVDVAVGNVISHAVTVASYYNE